jgi:hypothetical protein
MKYNIFSLIIIVLFFTNCYDDKGNYSYHDINTIEIGKFTGSTSLAVGDTIDIKPELTFSRGVETEGLKYTWDGVAKHVRGGIKKTFIGSRTRYPVVILFCV